MQTMVRWAIAATQGRSPLLDNRVIGSLRTVRRNLPAVAVSSRGFVPARMVCFRIGRVGAVASAQ